MFIAPLERLIVPQLDNKSSLAESPIFKVPFETVIFPVKVI